jgi:hypothetical protein
MTVFDLQGFVNFLAQFVKNVARSASYVDVFEVPRTREIDWKLGFYATRTKRN